MKSPWRSFDGPVVVVTPRAWAKVWAFVLAGHGLYAGIGYALGPPGWYSTPSLSVVRDFPVPVPLWGVLMFIYGLLLLTKWSFWGHALGSIVWAFWAACIWAVAFSELLEVLFDIDLGTQIVAWGAGWLATIPALLHCYMMLPRKTLAEYIQEAKL